MKLVEPLHKNVVTFFDCQNLFGAVKNLWGYSFPNFDPIKLSKLVISKRANTQWRLSGIRLYTGIHSVSVNPEWYNFWNKKLLSHRSQDPRVHFFTAPLRYSGSNVAREKGIDIRIALDLVRMARLNEYDVAVLFSQDSDFSEVAIEIRAIAEEKQRWMKIASAYPVDPSNIKLRGVSGTDWVGISKGDYDSCIDNIDYR